MTFKAGCIQINSTNDMAENIATASKLARAARAAGADIVLMPENVAMMEWGRANILAKSYPEDSHPALAAFRSLAKDTGAWIQAGSLHVLTEDGRVANRGDRSDPKCSVVAVS